VRGAACSGITASEPGRKPWGLTLPEILRSIHTETPETTGPWESLAVTKKFAAEFLGTLWLVLGGVGSAVLAAKFPEIGIGLVGISLPFGLTVLTMA